MPYFTNFFRQTYPNLSDQDINIMSPINQLFQFIGQNLAMPLINKYGVRKILLLCGLCYASSFFMISLFCDLVTFGFAFGILYNVSSGIVYMAGIGLAVEYFPNKKGLVAGTVVMFYAFSGLLLQSLVVKILNPDNIKPTINHKN